MDNVQHVIFDVDTGIDDSLALLSLLGSQRTRIDAVVCTAGNVPARQVAENTLGWLSLARADDVEVAIGAERPLIEPLHTTEDTHGPFGVGYAELPPHGRRLGSRHAAHVWSSTARSRPGEITGIVTGPLTNLALAIRLDPDLPKLLRRLVVMGGALNHPANTTPTAEWNIFVDPEAAKTVFDAFGEASDGRRLILTPLDITERIVMTTSHMERLAAAAGCRQPEIIDEHDPRGRRSRAEIELVRHISDAVRFYMEFHRDMGQGFIAHLHDPFAAASAMDESIAEYRPAAIDVELAGPSSRGQVVADWAGHWTRTANADVATATDPESVLADTIARIARVACRS